jgi:hypothetical protein
LLGLRCNVNRSSIAEQNEPVPDGFVALESTVMGEFAFLVLRAR